MPTNHNDLKKFAQSARRALREQVAARLEQVLNTDSAALRERESARHELVQQIAETSKAAVIDRVAYTWFNRFCALRFMDANRYNRIGVVSPAEGFTQPEILQEAKGGYIDEDLQSFVDCPAVFDLLAGRRPSTDPQQEAYRLLLVGLCNALNRAMPFLFEPIADYTELLMPQDLLSEHSILNDLREAMTPGACQDVEVIGWLYQFYISERKDEVFEDLKKGKKIAAEDIPAATQLFTPHWIVRYLVENSLGRLWMLNHPTSRLVEQMDYYIKPEEPETDFLRVASPEEIKVCDPACGSGHMLTYAFDLLTAIYEEEGYSASDIPRLILANNLYGIEIDERAGALAAFALAMKARGRDRRFFNRDIQPNICVLENISFTDQELQEYAKEMGRDLFTEPLIQTLKQFEDAKNFGSLIHPVVSDPSFIRSEMELKGLSGNIFLFGVNERVLQILKQAEFLSPCYHIVVANPPYMGSGGMNEDFKKYANDLYPKSKADLYAMFIESNLEITKEGGYIGMVTMQSWMFLSSYESLRKHLLANKQILSLAHLGTHAFDSIGGEVVSTTAFTIRNSLNTDYVGDYFRLIDGHNEDEKSQILRSNLHSENPSTKSLRYTVSSDDLKRIPGFPIAYWASHNIRKSFERNAPLSNYAETRIGLITGDNDHYIRLWHEVSIGKIGLGYSRDKAKASGKKWFPQSKGGEFRKWFGNNTTVVDWENDGYELQTRMHSSGTRVLAHNFNLDKIYLSGITWTKIASGSFAARMQPEGFLFNDASANAFPINQNLLYPLLGVLCSNVPKNFLQVMNPTLNFLPGDISCIPIPADLLSNRRIDAIVKQILEIEIEDWNSKETSWDFLQNPFLSSEMLNSSLQNGYLTLASLFSKITLELQQLEIENNRLIIESYGLTDEIEAQIPLEEVTITYNPDYRYGSNRSEAELEALLLADTMREFISYAVGCMFGRYSLDKPGLILANQGETLQDYLRKVYGSETPPASAFLPDEDNAIPVLDGEWFSDDITERFKKFLRVTFGAEHYEENLAFIEQAIGSGSKSLDIRAYFLKEFYSQHVKMYQKRPIYWMFSSPRGSFNVLIYMHRYQPDTLSVILNRYLRAFRGKLEARKGYLEQISINAGAPARERTAAVKEIEGLNKTLEEIRVYERDILYPLAVQGIQIDLDDGVKVNYNKFGKALAKINGLSE